MDFQDLKIFKELYLQRNITAVSKSLYLSQPSVSYRLRKLQEDLGVSLYEFDGRYHFNSRSKVFFDYCVKILDAHEKMLEQLREDEQYSVSLSTISTSLYQNIIFKTCLDLKLFPNIRTSTSHEAIIDVLEGHSRFAIVGGYHSELANSLDTIALRSEKIVFVYNKECSGDPRSTPIVLDQINSGIRKGIDDYLEQFDNINIVGEAGTTAHRLKLINEHSIGMFIQEKYLQNAQDLKNIAVSSEYYFIHDISLVCKKTELNNPITARLINVLNTKP
ncbi:MAG: LysR family transcriptional regulator [Candidatus Neomarinimicrobiota bacterium]